jgi:diketogulonate reductase-like aldo/keto reductase
MRRHGSSEKGRVSTMMSMPLIVVNHAAAAVWLAAMVASAVKCQEDVPGSLSPASKNATDILRYKIGFGTAALGSAGHQAVTWALEAGFRSFDTAEEHEHWYDARAVGEATRDYFADLLRKAEEDGVTSASCYGTDAAADGAASCRITIRALCTREQLRMTTKIPPWSLTSAEDIRNYARNSREQLVAFCDGDGAEHNYGPDAPGGGPFPLDAYYIHAPVCWRGWHPRCEDPPPNLLGLREAWLALEAVVGADRTARRIGLSNVRVDEFHDIVQFVREREDELQRRGGTGTAVPPRIPDVVQAYADPIEPSDKLREACEQLGIEFVSYSTLGTQHRYRRNRDSGDLENPVLTSPVVTRIADKHERSTAEVVLSWALARNMSIIPRSTNRQHITQLSRLFDDPAFLDPQDLRDIDAMKHTI